MLAKATKPKQQFYQTQEFQTFTTVVAVGAAFFTGGASLVALAAMNAGTGALTGLAQGGIQGALVGAIGGAANAYVSSYTGGAVNVGLSYTKEGGFGASVSGGVKGVASVGISASQHGGVSVNAGIEINPAIKASISASKDGVQTNLDVGKISVGVNYSKDGGFGGSIGYKGDNFTAGLNIGPGGKTSALLGATTTDGKYSGGLEFKSTGDVSGYVAAG
ncbi:MAG: hypothetical protein IT569_08230, partial [Leptospiraceae bacterium]|nr:hypothetical protein [Leptospiraceae bacterium]